MIERIDRSVGLVIELKFANEEKEINKKLDSAKEQIKEKEYYKELVLDIVDKIYEYVFIFDEKGAIVR